MITAWVLGSHGLLGSALCRQLSRHSTPLFSPEARFDWLKEKRLSDQIGDAVKGFSMQLGQASKWEIYWAAGVGTMSSAHNDLRPETRALEVLLAAIRAQSNLMERPGTIVLASSAGAIYAATKDAVITEATLPASTTLYAQEKMKQEALIAAFVGRSSCTNALLARISTLYGPGQSAGKRQGLLTHIARCVLRHQPIQIYVPFDTMRDYIAATDAASMMVAVARACAADKQVVTKIVASEQPTTIAEIIAIFRRVTRHGPRVVTSASVLSNLYSRRVQFASRVFMEYKPHDQTSLLVGISQLMAFERMALASRAA
jgi:UDP-glucose 4-epimerase